MNIPTHRTSISQIKELAANEIFVFGSNLAGIHGAGAALFARRKLGAVPGVGVGITGQCYALPTKSHYLETLPLEMIADYVQAFIHYAVEHPATVFLVTEVGCGLAGLKLEQVAPLFRDAVEVENIHLPLSFWYVLTQNA